MDTNVDSASGTYAPSGGAAAPEPASGRIGIAAPTTSQEPDTAPPPAYEHLDIEEGKERIAKLRLEQDLLKHQLSRSVIVLDWLKAATAPVAFVALLWTAMSGYDQMKQTRRAAIDDRFDRALGRIASADVKQRVTGVAGLKQFVGGSSLASQFSLISSYSRERDALFYLATALATETDAIARNQILQIFGGLKDAGVSSQVIDECLQLIIERNRELVESVGSAVGRKSLETLPPGDSTLAPLHATSLAIVSLLRQGARGRDLSRVYCVGCALSGRDIDLSNAVFDYAILVRSDFSHARLTGASFNGTVLVGALFVGADLRHAKLTDAPHDGTLGETALWRHYPVATAVDLKCADLSAASFIDQVVFGVSQDGWIWTYDFSGAKLDGADLSRIRIYAVFAAPDNLPSGEYVSVYQHGIKTILPFELDDSVAYDVRPVPDDTDQKDSSRRYYMALMTLGSKSRPKSDLGLFKASFQLLGSMLKSGHDFSAVKLPPALMAAFADVAASTIVTKCE